MPGAHKHRDACKQEWAAIQVEYFLHSRPKFYKTGDRYVFKK